MKIAEVLEKHGAHPHTVTEDSSVLEAVEKMILTKSDALVVMKNTAPAGIFTEHDVFRCHAAGKTALFSEMKVADVMQRNLISASPGEDTGNVLKKMLQADIRHLPVIGSGEILGILGINNIIEPHLEVLNSELQYLQEYIARLQDAGND